VAEQHLALGGGQTGHGGAQGRRVLGAHDHVVGSWCLGQVEQPRLVPPLQVAPGVVRRHQVARHGHRVRRHRVVGQQQPSRERPGQRLLDDVLPVLRVAHPLGDHPGEQPVQLRCRGRVEDAAGSSHDSRPSCARRGHVRHGRGVSRS